MSQLRAVSAAFAAYTFWVLADTCLKISGGSHLPVAEVIAVIGASICSFMLALHASRGGVRRLWPRHPRPQLLRSFLDLGNNVFVVIAVRHLPLTLFYILVFLAPLVQTLLAARFLGERLEWRNGLAILIGFLGVVLAVNPFSATRPGDLTGYLACMVCVACFSVSLVWSRRMTQSEAPESLTFFSGLVMCLAGAAGMLFDAQPVGGRLVLTLVAAGVCNVVGSLCFFFALKHTSSANVSQYHYTQLLTGAFLAWLIWRERLTPSMLAGAVLIIGAGIYTAAQSYRLSREAVAVPVLAPLKD